VGINRKEMGEQQYKNLANKPLKIDTKRARQNLPLELGGHLQAPVIGEL
jgi:hypothetical protein